MLPTIYYMIYTTQTGYRHGPTEGRELYKDRYHRYLRSPAWQKVRAAVRKRSDGMCERCGHHEADHVHHLSYKHIFDELSNLHSVQHVCLYCHDFLHGRSDIDPARYNWVDWFLEMISRL